MAIITLLLQDSKGKERKKERERKEERRKERKGKASVGKRMAQNSGAVRFSFQWG